MKNHQKNWKVGIIKCLLNRALSICNNYDYYEKEIKKLKENSEKVQKIEKRFHKSVFVIFSTCKYFLS